MVVKIQKVMPLVKRPWTDKMGNQQVFRSKGFIFNDGENVFYAEALQENADLFDTWEIKEGDVVSIFTQTTVHEYKTAQGETRFQNDIVVRKLFAL